MTTDRTPPTGLSSIEAKRRLIADGPNEVGGTGRRNALLVITDILREPMFLLLLAGGVTYLAIGDTLEAAVLSLFACASVGITIVQQLRSEKALAALRGLAAPQARVVRDGVTATIAGREVVRGDRLALDAGDRIAADALLVEGDVLEIDESLVTGEAIAVVKADGADRALRSGTLVTQGSASAIVTATGAASAIGRIAGAMSSLDMSVPRLRRETDLIVRICTLGGGVVALAVLLVTGIARGDWPNGILSGIAIGMALLPEEFAVVLAVYTAMGARRLAAAGVLTRRAAAIETLGATTVLCTDKTGTLTENRMRVVDHWIAEGSGFDIAALKSTAAFACLPASADPMDLAIQEGMPRDDGPVVKTYPLRRDMLAVGVARKGKDAAAEVGLKGAPEAVLSICPMSSDVRRVVLGQVAAMAEKGQRVLAVAKTRSDIRTLPDRLDDLTCEFVGLIGLIDPVRVEVPPAIATLRRAGIRIIMITGDHPATALAVAREAGIAAGDVIVGGELAGMPNDVLAARLAATTAVARATPDDKLSIVRALRDAGEMVAMIGDGVNDAPALRAADIGVAMGRRGTDVAREAGDIVLLDDRFATIPEAVSLGRRIYDNIRQAAGFIVAVHVPIAGLAVLPLFTGAPALLGPLHIALLEIIIDPTCALVFEAEPAVRGIMARPPRPREARPFDRPMLARSGVIGTMALMAVMATAYAAGPEMTLAETRTAVFIVLISTLIGMVGLHLRPGRHDGSRSSWRHLTLVASIVLALAAAALWLPPARSALGFAPPDLGIVSIAAVGVIAFLIAAGLLGQLGHSAQSRRAGPMPAA